MDEQRKQHLIKTLNDNGMTVLLTSDHSAIMLELVMLKQFDRQIRLAATVDGQLATLIKGIDQRHAELRRTLLPVA